RAETWVFDPEALAPQLDPTDLTPHDLSGLMIVPERLVHAPGEPLRFFVHTDRPGREALITIDAPPFFSTRRLTLERPATLLELPSPSAAAASVRVHVGAFDPEGGYFEEIGYEVYVLPTEGFLEVDVDPGQTEWRPGEKRSVAIEVTRSSRPAGEVEVEIAMIDTAALAVAENTGHESEDLRLAFHPLSIERRITDDEHIIGEVMRAGLHTDPSEGGFGGGGILMFGDDEEEGAGVGFSLSGPTARTHFPDTAYWRAHVVTDAQGRANLEVPVPGNLTRWRVLARAVSKDGAVGAGQAEVVTRQEVMVTANAPRFFVGGDMVSVPVRLANHRQQETTFEIRLTANGAANATETRELKLASGETAALAWQVAVTQIAAPGEVELAVEAKVKGSPGEGDALRIARPVYPRGREALVQQSGPILGSATYTIEVPDIASKSARLEIIGTSSGAAAVTQALPYLVGYPYGCVEQTMSRFLPAVVARKALEQVGSKASTELLAALPEITDRGLQRLYGFQHEDGGWGWWKHDDTHPFMTGYVVYGLLKAREAGIAVDEGTLALGLEALENLSGDNPTDNAYLFYIRRLAGGELSQELQEEFDATLEDFRAELEDGTDEDRRWLLSSAQASYLILAGAEGLADQATARPERAIESYAPGEVIYVALQIEALASIDKEDARIPGLI
ncbi:MAG: alpha-2-macroglobulin family protein, partial [Planctomycetota bacterium]